jgi:hypothetical protein
MVTVEHIIEEFPEFARASSDLVRAKLADADVLTSADYPAGLRDMRVKYLTAELLVLSPSGEFARLDPSKEPDGARSIYERRRIDIDRAALPQAMVL